MKKLIAVALLATLGLVGCGGETQTKTIYTVDQLKNNVELFKEQNAFCSSSEYDSSDVNDIELCGNVLEASAFMYDHL